MHSAASEQETNRCLMNDCSQELELLLRAVLCQQSEPILIAGDDHRCLDASSGAAKLLGLSVDQMIGQKIDELVNASQFERSVKGDVLPGRDVLVLGPKGSDVHAMDFAFLAVDAEGRIVAWYDGAERIYGYKSEEMIGRNASCLDLEDDDPVDIDDRLGFEAMA